MFDTSGSMREPQKANLAEAIWTSADCSTEYASSINDVQFVLDGGSLLHRIPWTKGVSFGMIINSYVNFVRQKYGKAIVVFDGYANGPSTKDAAHLRRTKGISGTKVFFTAETPFKSKKELCLGNVENKQNFINLLAEHLNRRDCQAIHAEGDADLTIVLTAIESAKKVDTVLVGEDTDLLVFLCYYAQNLTHNITFQSEMKPSSRKVRVWDIKKTCANLGNQLCKILPFVHAVSGCDTTSRLFGIGKAQAFKKAAKDATFIENADKFTNASCKEDALKYGEESLVNLYGGIQYENLDLLRFIKFTTKEMTSSNFGEVHTLPPTSNAAMFHILRVYYQVKQWMGQSEHLNVYEWGWHLENNVCLPVRSSLPPAPDELLKTIYCKCKGNCETKRCTCKKHGLQCSMACSECHGNTCSNSSGELLNESDTDG